MATISSTSTSALRLGQCAATDNIKQPIAGWNLADKQRSFPDSVSHTTWNQDCRDQYGVEWSARSADADGGVGGDWSRIGGIYGQARCVQTAHMASIYDCCTTGQPANPYQTTCNSDWTPDTTCCIESMKTFCSNRANFFTPRCMTWLKNLGNNSLKDEIAKPVCSNYVFSTSPAEAPQRAFCACYNARVPASLKNDPVLRSFAQCLDQGCAKTDLALQPADKLDCNLNYVVCTNADNQTQLINAGIDKQIIQNQCAINVGGNTGGNPVPSPPTPGPGGNPPPPSGNPTNNGISTWVWIGLGVFLLIMVIGIVVIIMISSGGSNNLTTGRIMTSPPLAPYYRQY